MTEQTPEQDQAKDKLVVVLMILFIIVATFGVAFGYYFFV